MEIIATLGILLVTFLIESHLHLSFMQRMFRKSEAKLDGIISDNVTNLEIQAAANEVYGLHKMRNLIANSLARFLRLSALVANIGMLVCLGASIFFFFNSNERYGEAAFLTIGIYLLWIAVKWLVLILARVIADTTPGGPEATLKLINQTDFEADLALQSSKLHSENPELEELTRALQGD